MTCSACSSGLEKYLKKQEGIHSVEVNLVMAIAKIEYDDTICDKKQIELWIKKAGFKSLGEEEGTSSEQRRKQQTKKLIIFTILAVVFFYISMGHMFHLPAIPFLDPGKYPLSYATALLLFTICFLIYGRDILKSGIKNLLHKTPNMDTLVTIGVISSFLYSVYGFIQIAKGDLSFLDLLYFESASFVIYFIKLGRFIDFNNKEKTKEAIQGLVQITPKEATKIENGKEKKVTIDEIREGDIIVSRAGEKIAVDGEIIQGEAHLEVGFITGESKPVKKKKGDTVIAGSTNYNGYLKYRAQRIGKNSTISQIVQLVMEATATKAPIARIADTVSGYFVPVVFLLALLSLLLSIIGGNPFSSALNAFITVLVIACPCSLGLATPLAIVVSEGKGAKNGILIKKSEVFELLPKIDTVLFDKTGTLTYGTLKIAEVKNFSTKKDEELLQIVTSIELQSNHPIKNAFQTLLEEEKWEVLPVEQFKVIDGKGITGTIEKKQYLLGNQKLLSENGISNHYQEKEKELAQKGNSIIYVVEEKEILALIGVQDIIRKEAKQVIKELKKRKIQTIMLTGDQEQTAKTIAQECGIEEVIANVLPEEKADKVKRLKKEGKHILMCGDGINDSPSLALADIGVSLKGATDIAMDSADVLLMNADLSKIIELFDLGHNTMKIIHQNLFWAFFYNVIMIPVAMGIVHPFGITINPMIASIAMIFSSLTVILNTLRLKGDKKNV